MLVLQDLINVGYKVFFFKFNEVCKNLDIFLPVPLFDKSKECNKSDDYFLFISFIFDTNYDTIIFVILILF